MLGIDVSRWQGRIDWSVVKKHVDFAIIKAGGSDAGFYKDPTFEYNYEQCKKNKIPVGAYYFVGNRFWGSESGEIDAQKFLEQLKGKDFDLPVYLDIEAQNRAYRREVTAAAIAFCERIEKEKGFVGIYGSEYSTFDEMVYSADLTRFSWWVANYSRKPKKNYLIWQSSSTGSISGIAGNVDLDHADDDNLKAVIAAIKKKGLNKWK